MAFNESPLDSGATVVPVMARITSPDRQKKSRHGLPNDVAGRSAAVSGSPLLNLCVDSISQGGSKLNSDSASASCKTSCRHIGETLAPVSIRVNILGIELPQSLAMAEPGPQAVAEYIAELMDKRGMNHVELAAEMKYSRQRIDQILKGEWTYLHTTWVENLCRVFGVSPTEFLRRFGYAIPVNPSEDVAWIASQLTPLGLDLYADLGRSLLLHHRGRPETETG